MLKIFNCFSFPSVKNFFQECFTFGVGGVSNLSFFFDLVKRTDFLNCSVFSQMKDRFPAVVVGTVGARVGRAVAVIKARVRGPHRGQVSDLVFLVVVVFAGVGIVGVVAEVDATVALGGAARQEGVVGHVGVPRKGASPRTGGCQGGPLVGRLHRDDQVGRIGDHHVRYLKNDNNY